MRRYSRFILAVALTMTTLTPSAPTTAHVWANYCTTDYGLANVFEHSSQGGTQDNACYADSDWGDSSGWIRSFNDTMTSYHLRDRGGDGIDTCFWFFRDNNQGGPYFVGNNDAPLGGNNHFDEDNVGSSYNDWVTSNVIYQKNASGSCVW